MTPTDWYKTTKGNYEWIDGSDDIEGYEHLGQSLGINSVTNYNGVKEVVASYSLNSDGSVTTGGTTYNRGETIKTKAGNSITSKNTYFDNFTIEPEVTANVTAAAGGVLTTESGIGGGAYTGVVGIGMKDNQFYLAGHPITSAGFGPEVQNTWVGGDIPAIGGSSETSIARNGSNIVSETEKTTLSITPYMFFESGKNVKTGQTTSKMSFGQGFTAGFGLIAEIGWKVTFWKK